MGSYSLKIDIASSTNENQKNNSRSFKYVGI